MINQLINKLLIQMINQPLNIAWDSLPVTKIEELKQILRELLKLCVNQRQTLKILGITTSEKIDFMSIEFQIEVMRFQDLKVVGKRLNDHYHSEIESFKTQIRNK